MSRYLEVWLPSLYDHSYIFNVRCLSTFLSYAGFSGAINYLSSKTCLFSKFCFSLPTSRVLLSKLRILLSYSLMYYRIIISFTLLITVSTEIPVPIYFNDIIVIPTFSVLSHNIWFAN